MAKPKSLPDLDILDSMFIYEPDTGLFRHKHNGDVAGSQHLWNGYVGLSIKGEQFMAHRIAWKMHYREEPPEKIDHKDLVKYHNWILNLRAANSAANSANRRKPSNNTTGNKNIHFRGSSIYVIIYKNRIKHQKRFDDLGSAIEWRNEKGRELFGEFYCEE